MKAQILVNPLFVKSVAGIIVAGVADALRSSGYDVRQETITDELALMLDVCRRGRDGLLEHFDREVPRKAAAWRPDVLFIYDSLGSRRHNIGRSTIEAVRERTGAHLVYHFLESPYWDKAAAANGHGAGYDTLLVNDRASVSFWRTQHPHVFYMPHCYHPDVHRPPRKPVPKLFDLFFAGAGWPTRQRQIDALVAGGVRPLLIGEWRSVENIIGFADIVTGFVSPARLVDVTARSKICLNIHRTERFMTEPNAPPDHIAPGEAWSANPRVFETLACGGFLLTDHRPELDALGLRDGEHLAIFRTTAELVEKARYYLKHDAERERIAEAGRAAIQGRSYKDRVREIVLPAVGVKA